MNDTTVEFKLDTGAQVNVIPRSIYKKLKLRPVLKPSKVRLTAYNNTTIPIHGKCIATLKYQGKSFQTLFVVVDVNSSPILGLKTGEKLNLIKRVYNIDSADDMFEEFKDCFGELGCIQRTYHIQLKPDSKPVQSPSRKIPFALEEKLQKEPDRMEALGVIEKISKPTDWLNTLVVAEKPNGKLRICLDPRPLNKVIKGNTFSYQHLSILWVK